MKNINSCFTYIKLTFLYFSICFNPLYELILALLFIALHLQPGTILISSPNLEDPNFEKVVICICEYNNKGAMGFVINQQFSRNLNELLEFSNCKNLPLFAGGPMMNENLYFIHQRPDIIKDGAILADGIYLGGNFKQAVTHINTSIHPEEDIKLFIGYCGWDAHQLEEEINEGSWMITNTSRQIILSYNTLALWEQLYENR